MHLDQLSRFECIFESCERFQPGAQVSEVFSLLEVEEGVLIDPRTREKHPDPLRSVREGSEGCLFGSVSYRQAALQPDVYDYHHAAADRDDALSRPGSGSLSYFPNTRTLILTQYTEFSGSDLERATKLERVGVGLLQFIYHFAPLLQAQYAFVDGVEPESDTFPGEAYRETGDVALLCWANYFGPAIVDRVGGEFLRQAPCWRNITLPGGGILCVVTEKVLEWRFGKHRSVVQYFRQQFPEIEEL